MSVITDDDIVKAMVDFGGGFAQALGQLYRPADDDNRARIKAGWPELWAQYSELARLKLAKAGR